jgi:hypothetical protein
MMTQQGLKWLEMSERFAESRLTTEERSEIVALNVCPRRSGAVNDADSSAFWALSNNINHAVFISAREAEKVPASGLHGHYWKNRIDEERIVQCRLLRDIFGNPFRPVKFDPRWLTSTVVDLAQAIYDERAFDRMPILPTP